jgi:hypothetical protein
MYDYNRERNNALIVRSKLETASEEKNHTVVFQRPGYQDIPERCAEEHVFGH